MSEWEKEPKDVPRCACGAPPLIGIILPEEETIATHASLAALLATKTATKPSMREVVDFPAANLWNIETENEDLDSQARR
jgi:hypothetical protein